MGAIRLFLACGVFLLHLNEQVLVRPGLGVNPIWVANLIGGRAVILFYIVSGFLISHALNNKYPAGVAGTRAFYRSRFLRIYPLWWVVLLACLALDISPWTGGAVRDALPAALIGSDWAVAFGRYPLPDWSVFPPGAEVGWTLGAELAFYLLAPWVLRSPSRVTALLVGSAAVRASLLWLIAPDDPSFKTWSYLFFPSILVFFLLGHLAERLHRARPIGAALSAALMATAVSTGCRLDASTSVGDPWFHLVALCFAAGLPGIFAATKDHRVSNFLGDLTYPLYLTHSLVIIVLFSGPLGGLGQRLIAIGRALGSADLAGACTAVSCFVVALCAAVAIHLAVESPLRAVFAWLIDRAASAWFHRRAARDGAREAA